MSGQFRHAVATSGYPDSLGADHSAAFDIVGRVTDDDGLLGTKIDGVAFFGSAQGMGTEVVAARAIIGKCAKFKIGPHLKVGELDFGPALQVAGQ